MTSIPVVDLADVGEDTESEALQQVARQIGEACRESGFFYVTGHGIPQELQERLENLSRRFFAQDDRSKQAIRMELGGRAWRGYFPVGSELTSGQPDQKEGIYFGAERGRDDPAVKAGLPLHGPNLFPQIDGFRETVLTWMDRLTQLGHRLLQLIAVSLGVKPTWFSDGCTSDPLILFRIFHYPPLAAQSQDVWSVGEHTDYGLLTILKQDHVGGLQIRSRSTWIDAPVIHNAFVCNLGDMLDRMTGGLYRSTPHRVRNLSESGRLSFPFFIDPGWNAVLQPIRADVVAQDDSAERWDGANVHDWAGTYGDYILSKVARVFPQLTQRTGSAADTSSPT